MPSMQSTLGFTHVRKATAGSNNTTAAVGDGGGLVEQNLLSQDLPAYRSGATGPWGPYKSREALPLGRG